MKDKSPLNKELVKEFMKHVTKELKLDSLPKIKFSTDSQEAVEHKSWGGYRPGDKSIHIVIANRHPADIFRTLAHELVHYKQDITGRLKPGDGKTGSDIENEANSRAAIILRNFAQEKPKLFEHLVTELEDDSISFTYEGGPFNKYRFKTDQNEYIVLFMNDGRGNYDRVYKTKNGFNDTQEGKPFQINKVVMDTTLDFIKKTPDFNTIQIIPKEQRRYDLVKRFIDKDLPSQYHVDYDPNKITINNTIKESLITELSFGLENALPFTHVGGTNNEYIFKTDQNEYKVAFKPDGESTYERVYHTTNRSLGTNYEDTKEGKPLQINATVMDITLDFMKRNPDFTMIYIVPIDSKRFNLVTSYIKNNLPSNYSFIAEPGKSENIIAIYNSPTPPEDIEI
jgi:hypothetical protein